MMGKDQKKSPPILKEQTGKSIQCRAGSVGELSPGFPTKLPRVYKTITDETGQKESAGE